MNPEQVFHTPLTAFLSHPLLGALVFAVVSTVFYIVINSLFVGPVWSRNIFFGIFFGFMGFFVMLFTFSNAFTRCEFVAVDIPDSETSAFQSVFNHELRVDAVSSALKSQGYNVVDVKGSFQSLGEKTQHNNKTEFVVNKVLSNNEPTFPGEMETCVVNPLRVNDGALLSKSIDFTVQCHKNNDNSEHQR